MPIEVRIIDYIDRIGPPPSPEQKAKFKKVWAELRKIVKDHPVDIEMCHNPLRSNNEQSK